MSLMKDNAPKGMGKTTTVLWTLFTVTITAYTWHRRNEFRKDQKSIKQMPNILQ